MYSFGFDTLEMDVFEAMKWFRKSSEQGNVKAQKELANRYYYGLDVEKDEVEAAKWYRKAAERGFDEAQYQVGLFYSTGVFVEENLEEAKKWLYSLY